MNKRDILSTFRTLGWSIETDEVGDKFAIYRFEDRLVSIFTTLRQLPDSQTLSVLMSVQTEEFSSACATISGRDETGTPLDQPRNWPTIEAEQVLEIHIRQLAEEAIEWAKGRDLLQGLQRYAALPTDCIGALPLRHLAALALLGDQERLGAYQASFRAGDRLGFALYITDDYVDRAVALAVRVSGSGALTE